MSRESAFKTRASRALGLLLTLTGPALALTFLAPIWAFPDTRGLEWRDDWSAYWIGGRLLAIFACPVFLLDFDEFKPLAGPTLVFNLLLSAAVWLASEQIAYARVFIENYSPTAVELRLDGRPWRSAPAHSTQKALLWPGEYELVTLEAGTLRELDRRTVVAEAPLWANLYVLNVLGAHTYFDGSQEYGVGSVEAFPVRQFETNEVWIMASRNYVFKEPPMTATTYANMRSDSRTFFLREPMGSAP